MTRIMVKQLPDYNVVYCDTGSEDDDNQRFLKDIENWCNIKIETIKSDKYKDVDDVIAKTRYLRGSKGARCTTELKINVRLNYADVNDLHYWGFTSDEKGRIERWETRNYMLKNVYPLPKYHITKQMCYAILNEAGIELPKMYKLGYDHNNCIGCLKAESPYYWNKIRIDYPEVFQKRAEQSRELKFALVSKKVKGKRIYIHLDELDPMDMEKGDVDISCDIGCQAIYNTIIR